MKRNPLAALLLAVPLVLSLFPAFSAFSPFAAATAHALPAPRTALSATADDAFWTGCQQDTWAVKGCGQYGMTEAARRACPGGYQYYCVS